MAFPRFTAAEHVAIDAVLHFQWTFAPPGSGSTNVPPAHELHIALDGQGAAVIAFAVHPARGGHMTQPMRAAANSPGGCHIIHNHPSQASLSADDWTTLAAHPRLQMTAVNSEGTSFRGQILRAPRFQAPATGFRSCWHHVMSEFALQTNAWFGAAGNYQLGCFATANGWLEGRAIGSRLEALGYAEFECLPQRVNAQALTDPRALVIEQYLAQLCAQLIV